MGKKRIEKIGKLDIIEKRRVTLCKRKKGLIKKCIELSVLCDLKICMFIWDDNSSRSTHFMSQKSISLMDLFNGKYKREFFTNSDY